MHTILKQQELLVFLKTSGYFCGFSLNLDTSKETSLGRFKKTRVFE